MTHSGWVDKNGVYPEIINNDFYRLTIAEAEIVTNRMVSTKVLDFLKSKNLDNSKLPGINISGISGAFYIDVPSKFVESGEEFVSDINGEPIKFVRLNSGYLFHDSDGLRFARLKLTNGDYVIFEEKSKIDTSLTQLEQNGKDYLDLSENSTFVDLELHFPQFEINISRILEEVDGFQIRTSSSWNDKVGCQSLSYVMAMCKIKMTHYGDHINEVLYPGMSDAEYDYNSTIWRIADTFSLHFIRQNDLEVNQVYLSALITPDDFKHIQD
jgi:hypothetical protein